jgi:hypothetical protein
MELMIRMVRDSAGGAVFCEQLHILATEARTRALDAASGSLREVSGFFFNISQRVNKDALLLSLDLAVLCTRLAFDRGMGRLSRLGDARQPDGDDPHGNLCWEPQRHLPRCQTVQIRSLRESE